MDHVSHVDDSDCHLKMETRPLPCQHYLIALWLQRYERYVCFLSISCFQKIFTHMFEEIWGHRWKRLCCKLIEIFNLEVQTQLRSYIFSSLAACQILSYILHTASWNIILTSLLQLLSETWGKILHMSRNVRSKAIFAGRFCQCMQQEKQKRVEFFHFFNKIEISEVFCTCR